MNKLLSPSGANFHWVVLSALLVIYTGYDIYEHISRGDIFAEYPLRWAIFSLASVTSILTIAIVSSVLLKKATSEIVASTLGITLAVLCHLTLSGPLWDQLFWFNELHFVSIWKPIQFAVIVYLAYRAIFYGVNKLMTIWRK